MNNTDSRFGCMSYETNNGATPWETSTTIGPTCKACQSTVYTYTVDFSAHGPVADVKAKCIGCHKEAWFCCPVNRTTAPCEVRKHHEQYAEAIR